MRFYGERLAKREAELLSKRQELTNSDMLIAIAEKEVGFGTSSEGFRCFRDIQICRFISESLRVVALPGINPPSCVRWKTSNSS